MKAINKKCFTKYKSIIYGIEILRVILCFWVIAYHYSGIKIQFKYKIITHFYHVPTFFFISFYLTYKIFIQKSIIKIKQRFERLIIPYTTIPIIFLIIKFFSSNFKKNIKKILLIIYTIVFGIIFFFQKKIIYLFFKCYQ